MKAKWTDSLACRSGRLCVLCRDSGDNGAAWRARYAASYEMPGDCPHGVPWDAKQGKATPMPVSLTVGDSPCSSCGGKAEPDTFVEISKPSS